MTGISPAATAIQDVVAARVWTPDFACPGCGATLECRDCTSIDGDGPWYRLNACGRCAFVPRVRDGVWTLISRDDEAAGAPFASQYTGVRQREGYAAVDAAAYRRLPCVERGAPRWREWQVRRQSCARLLADVLPAFARHSLCIADLGAGNGWLSRLLAASGHRVIAVDRLSDPADGLAATRMADVPFAAVVADFARPPFAPAQFDAVIFNASLHYAADPGMTLTAAARLLKPGGGLVVMDSPMFRHEWAGQRMVEREDERLRREHRLATVVRPGPGFLTFGSLDRFARALGMRNRFLSSRGPLRWQAGRAWARVRLGRAPAAFGVWVAQ